jgi:hypothetical protein
MNPRFGTLIDQSYGPGVTNLRRRFNRSGESPASEVVRDGPMRSNPVPFALIGGAPAITIAVQNPHRKGLLIQNRDATNDLFVGFGTLADANGFAITALGYVLLDFICPTDAISVFALVNVRGFMVEMAPIAS